MGITDQQAPDQTSDEQLTLDAALEQAFEAQSARSDSTPAEPTEEDQSHRPSAQSHDDSEDPTGSTDGTDATETNKPQDPAPEGADDQSQVTADSKPPISWSATAREHWAALPAEVKAVVANREREIEAKLKETVEDRRFASEIKNAVQPFNHILAQEKATPAQALNYYLQVESMLRSSPSRPKAQLVANLINQFAINPEEINQILSGQQPTGQQSATSQYEQQIAALQAQVNQMQQAPVLAEQQRIAQEIEAFSADSNNEFFNDVREDMAALLQAGRATSLQDAYDKAVWANTSTRAVLNQRAQTQQAQQRSQQTATRRSAAASVSGNPSSQQLNEPSEYESLDDALNYAISKAGGRV